MARARIVESGGRTSLAFVCPGCNGEHVVTVSGPDAWTWNGSLDRPTLTPSVLLRSGHHAPGHKPGDPCWCTFNAARPPDERHFDCRVCHSFVTDGRIQLLGDCTHALAGRMVDLPEIAAG